MGWASFNCYIEELLFLIGYCKTESTQLLSGAVLRLNEDSTGIALGGKAEGAADAHTTPWM